MDALCYQAAGLLQIAGAVEEALFSHLLEPFRLIEMPLVPALADMAFYGIRIDRACFPPMLSLIQQRLLLLKVGDPLYSSQNVVRLSTRGAFPREA